MFFGKRRRPKGREPDPVPDDSFLDEEFGFEEEAPPAEREKGPAGDEPAPGRPRDDDSDLSRSGGRSLEDATFVERPADPSPPLVPEPPPGGGGGDEDLPDATVVIGRAVSPGTLAVGWLVSTAGASRGRDFRLDERCTRVGTAPDAAIRLPGDPYVSTHHAEIELTAGEFLLRDLGSTNGTFRNDERISDVVLADGDRVRFGLSDFVFKCVSL